MPNLIAWRLEKEKWANASFTGAGAAVDGGRWNSAGVRVVYLSEHLAMAAQEKYVHLPKPVPAAMSFVRFRAKFDEGLVHRVDLATLPGDWRVAPPSRSTQAIGDEWVLANTSAVLALPSAIIPEETNYLFNPAHRDFPKIQISDPEPFYFDYRIARLVNP